jgi:hypothetical protein
MAERGESRLPGIAEDDTRIVFHVDGGEEYAGEVLALPAASAFRFYAAA